MPTLSSCSFHPSQALQDHVLVGLLTCELERAGPSRRASWSDDYGNGVKAGLVRWHSLTAGGAVPELHRSSLFAGRETRDRCTNTQRARV